MEEAAVSCAQTHYRHYWSVSIVKMDRKERWSASARGLPLLRLLCTAAALSVLSPSPTSASVFVNSASYRFDHPLVVRGVDVAASLDYLSAQVASLVLNVSAQSLQIAQQQTTIHAQQSVIKE